MLSHHNLLLLTSDPLPLPPPTPTLPPPSPSSPVAGGVPAALAQDPDCGQPCARVPQRRVHRHPPPAQLQGERGGGGAFGACLVFCPAGSWGQRVGLLLWHPWFHVFIERGRQGAGRGACGVGGHMWAVLLYSQHCCCVQCKPHWRKLGIHRRCGCELGCRGCRTPSMATMDRAQYHTTSSAAERQQPTLSCLTASCACICGGTQVQVPGAG
jgi:hypothetical protein